jgi:hypothetical protein
MIDFKITISSAHIDELYQARKAKRKANDDLYAFKTREAYADAMECGTVDLYEAIVKQLEHESFLAHIAYYDVRDRYIITGIDETLNAVYEMRDEK